MSSSSCKHQPKKLNGALRALKRGGPGRGELICLSCGEALLRSAAQAHAARHAGHHVLLAHASSELVCLKCPAKRLPRYFDVGVVVEPDDKLDEEELAHLVAFAKQLLAPPESGLASSSSGSDASEGERGDASSARRGKGKVGKGKDKDKGKGKARDKERSRHGMKSAKTKGEEEEEEEEEEEGKRAKGSSRGAKAKRGGSRAHAHSGSGSSGSSSESEAARGASEAEDALAVVGDGPRLFGIANLGNSCYLSAVVQVLAHSPPLVAALHALGPVRDLSGAVLEALDAVRLGPQADVAKSKPKPGPAGGVGVGVGASSSGGKRSGKAVSLARALGLITYRAPQLAGFSQQDAHELLVELLRALEEDEKAGWAEQQPHEECGDDDEQDDKGRTGRCEARRPYVWRLFSTDVRSTVRCLHCGHESSRVEECVAPSLDICGETIRACLERGAFAESKLLRSEGNGLECERCSATAGNNGDGGECAREAESVSESEEGAKLGRDLARLDLEEKRESACEKRDAVKTEFFTRAPPLLALHLKRFQSQVSKGRVVSDKISSPVELSESESLLVHTDVRSSPTRHAYRLFGVVSHRGKSMHRGHYISFVRPAPAPRGAARGAGGGAGGSAGLAPRGEWWCANDEKVMRMPSAQAVLHDSNCYIALYERLET